MRGGTPAILQATPFAAVTVTAFPVPVIAPAVAPVAGFAPLPLPPLLLTPCHRCCLLLPCCCCQQAQFNEDTLGPKKSAWQLDGGAPADLAAQRAAAGLRQRLNASLEVRKGVGRGGEKGWEVRRRNR